MIFGFGQTEDLGWLALKHWSILTHMSVCVCVSLYLSSQKKLGPLSTFWIPTTFRYLLDTLYFQVHIKCLQPFGTFGYLKPVCILWIPWTLNTSHDAFDRDSCRAMLGPLFAQVAWPRGYDLRQSTRLELIPSCPAGRVIGLGNSGLSAPDYYCPAIIREKLEATEARWLWMEFSISYIFCQLRLIHSRSINI